MSDPLSFEDQYFNILLSIESSIDAIYKENNNLMDFSVDKALSGAVRTLTNQQRDRQPPKLKFSADEQAIYDRFMSIADLYTGEDGELVTEDGEEIDLEMEVVTIDEMIACFKRIQRSIKTWSDYGRQGYLNFIKQFFGG